MGQLTQTRTANNGQTWETVKNVAEETACDWCGCPLYVRDKYILAADWAVYCSRSCCKSGTERKAGHHGD